MTELPSNAILQDRKWVRLSDGTTQADITTDGELKTTAKITDGTNTVGVMTIIDSTDDINSENAIITSSAMFARINESKTAPIRADASTHTIQTIDYEHHEVHAGSHYVYTDGVTLANAATQQWMVTTPSGPGECHMIFTFLSGLGSIWTLYEGGDRVGTDLKVAGNSNRNSLNTAGCVIHKNTGGGTIDGDLIATLALGSASASGKAGGSTRSAEELILKFSTKYLMTCTSQAIANNITIFMTFYEHTPRN